MNSIRSDRQGRWSSLLPAPCVAGFSTQSNASTGVSLAPLHSADDHDAGGTKKLVTAEGLHPGDLHRYWDIELVEQLGTDPHQVTARLVGQISEAKRQEWAGGRPEAFALARSDAYGLLPRPGDQGSYSLPSGYVDQAVMDVGLQLSRAGVRLASILNQVLSAAP